MQCSTDWWLMYVHYRLQTALRRNCHLQPQVSLLSLSQLQGPQQQQPSCPSCTQYLAASCFDMFNTACHKLIIAPVTNASRHIHHTLLAAGATSSPRSSRQARRQCSPSSSHKRPQASETQPATAAAAATAALDAASSIAAAPAADVARAAAAGAARGSWQEQDSRCFAASKGLEP